MFVLTYMDCKSFQSLPEPWQFKYGSSMTSLNARTVLVGLELGSQTGFLAFLAQAEHFPTDAADLLLCTTSAGDVGTAALAAQQPGVFFAVASLVLDAATRCTKKTGGATPLAFAQANFSSSEWQQHLSQQCAALWQPQGHFSQGKRSSVDFETGIGRPVIPTRSETNRHATTTCVQVLRFGHFRLNRRMNTWS